MKIYVQTETTGTGEVAERRARALVLETAAPLSDVERTLEAIARGLGRIAAVPAPAHEHNLKAILPRDLATLGIAPGASTGGEATLVVVRSASEAGPTGQTDIFALAYRVDVVPAS